VARRFHPKQRSQDGKAPTTRFYHSFSEITPCFQSRLLNEEAVHKDAERDADSDADPWGKMPAQ
jgi:hypothetical protein